MPRETTASSMSKQQCTSNCNNRQSACLNSARPSNPSPTNSYNIRQCYTQGTQCRTNCVTNNIRKN